TRSKRDWSSDVCSSDLLDFGVSIRDNIPVFDHIRPRFFITMELAIYGTIFAVVFGLLVGIVSAARQYSFSDVALMVVALFGLSKIGRASCRERRLVYVV